MVNLVNALDRNRNVSPCSKPLAYPFRTHPEDTMPEVKSILREVLPKQGLHRDICTAVDTKDGLWTLLMTCGLLSIC